MRAGLCLCCVLALALLGFSPLQARGDDAPFASLRIRFLDAAIVRGDKARLGEVAVPIGEMPPGRWEEFAGRELWPSPPEKGRPMSMSRPRLQEAVMRSMPDLAPFCLFPGSMLVQRGGALVGKEEIRRLAEREVLALAGALPGEVSLRDFRLPQQVFLEHAGQRLVVERPRKVEAGRISLRLLVLEADGQVRQKLTGTVFADCHADVPCLTRGVNRDDLLDHNLVAYKRMNLALLRGEPWDGRGGPWRLNRPIPAGQPIYRSDLASVPTIRKGDRVTLLYEGKTVRLTALAEALSDGVAGGNISVRNLQSRKEIQGMVRDAKTVNIAARP